MDKINVTKTFLPPIEEFNEYVERIWKSGYLTNQGPLLKKFESETKKYLSLKSNLQLVSNGTIALQLTIEALGIKDGEIITTPFSYVATTSAIMWQRCNPVFVDIDPDTLCIDPSKIEAAISSKTKAIMPVHVFGNPCDIEKIDEIAKKHNLKVIYDAAHAFGVKYKGRSLLDYGDVSICSFHATKLFHTIEGGAIVSKDKDFNNSVELVKRFGHNVDDHLILGMNGKANEFQAAMGLCNLKYIDENISTRRGLTELYDKLLSDRYGKIIISNNTDYNFSYYPILFKNEALLKKKLGDLEEVNIYPRRYFYPSLNKLPYIRVKQACPISEVISRRVVCLPLYAELKEDEVRKICEVLSA